MHFIPPIQGSVVSRYVLGGLMVAFGLAQLTAAFVGSTHVLGSAWAWVLVVGATMVGFAAPMAIGAFVGALRVWHWHWTVAAIFAVPRLATVLPGYASAVLAKLRHG